MKSLSENTLISNYQMKMNNLTEKPSKDNYEVYWIHHKNHDNILKQGYVGITKVGIHRRFYNHCRDAANGSDNVVHKALRKYNEEIVVDVICICDEDYARQLESNLRPKENIGWNIVPGGGGGVEHIISLIGRKEWGSRISSGKKESFKNNPESLKFHGERSYYKDKKYRKKQSEAQREAHKKNPQLAKALADRQKAKKPWENNNVNKEVWLKSDFYYELYSYSELSHRQQSIQQGLSPDGLRKMYKLFCEGWNPNKDNDWLKWRDNYE